jgi:hypothetical protein
MPPDTTAKKRENRSRQVAVRLSVDEVNELQQMADSEERSLSAQVRFLIRRELQGRENTWSQ